MYKFEIEIKVGDDLTYAENLAYFQLNIVEQETGKKLKLMQPVIESMANISHFLKNERAILSDDLPIPRANHQSLSEAINQCYDNAFEDESESDVEV